MFIELFNKILIENRKSLSSLENTKDIRKEVERLKKLMLKQSERAQMQTFNDIKYLEKKIKEMF